MARINLDLDDLTPTALKRLVKQLLSASDEEEAKIVSKLGKRSASEEKKEAKPHKAKNDLADLHEEMHGTPNTPMVEDDEEMDDGELPDVPKKKKGRV
jgi:hypothetical protein